MTGVGSGILEETAGSLLGGRVPYIQPRAGFRTGIEPVLLAAAVPARAGERVLEAGCGAGAGLLCLLARVPGLFAQAIERDPAMAAFARRNIRASGQEAGVHVADVVAWRAETGFDHAFANPPWHQGGTASPVPGRAAAKQASPGLLHAWAASLSRTLARRGTLTLIVPASAAMAAAAALAEARCAEITLIPLWPHASEPARLAILRGIKEGRGGTTLHPGLVLHEQDGSFTPAAQAILGGGQRLV